MRLVLSSLIAAAGLASVAQAQEPAAQPAPPPATEAPPPAAVPVPAPAPAAEAPPAPPAEAPPPPVLPTSGSGFDAIQILEKVCVPGVTGQKMEDVAKANGFKLNRRDETWTKQFGTENRAYQVIIQPQYSNKSACTVELRYAMGQDAEIAKALNVWAFVHQPPLEPTANYTQPQDPDGKKRVRRSWEYVTQGKSIGLNYSTVRNPDDSPLNAKYDTGVMYYQERTLP